MGIEMISNMTLTKSERRIIGMKKNISPSQIEVAKAGNQRIAHHQPKPRGFFGSRAEKAIALVG